ncbi:restriction endonuclease S subunit [Streptococcus pneumoniae]|uniref:hypothetical protein n=1 Tax=Streptococcus pneumoniae TaxID=1313 RepID=UPI0010241092|nr:hypothetical protein [Streptococcus pneumoniae]VFH76077.1 restriction endonuclease S subunit [Streptococcus pneumoniae]
MTPEQLKASILQRAMEGKLVPQNPNDEPASELLKRIKAEKEKLISEGKIKRDKKETEIFRGDDGKHYGKFADGSTQEIDVPYDIPDTWEWVRFKNSLKKARLKRKIWTFLLFPKEMITLIMGTKTKQPLILYMKSQKHGDILNLLA